MFLMLANHFGHTPIKLLGDVGQVEAGFSLSRDSVNLSARRMVCAEHTISWEIILDAPDGTPT
jgi:hypothetical protein